MLRLRFASKIIVASLVLTVGSVVFQTGIASAGPGTCRDSSDTGCLAWYKSLWPNADEYRFAVSDSNLSNNHFVTESCGFWPFPDCIPDLVVENHIGWMRMNSYSVVRMCIYANHNYLNPLYWVTQHLVWATTGQAGASLYYNSVNSC